MKSERRWDASRDDENDCAMYGNGLGCYVCGDLIVNMSRLG